MKKSFEYDQTKYDPSAPKKTEEFLTADGVKTLTTDANDGAVLIQDEVDGDSLNPVTGAAVVAAIEAGGGGTTVIANEITMSWNSSYSHCYYNVPAESVPAITTGVYLVRFSVAFTSSTPPTEFSDMSAPACITAGVWSTIGGTWGFESEFVLLPSTNGAGNARAFEGTGVFTIDVPSFVPTYFKVQVRDQSGHNVTTAPNIRKYTLVKIG